MNEILMRDKEQFGALLESVVAEAQQFLTELDHRPVGVTPPAYADQPKQMAAGIGAEGAMALFKSRYAPWLSGSAGPRYFGYVTGGATPAGLMGDWLVSIYDQNALGSRESVAPQIELETLSLLRQLFCLPEAFQGSFVSGATMSNFVNLAIARQWVGRQRGIDIAQQGLSGAEPIRVLSAVPHSSVYKAMAMLGIGRDALVLVPKLAGREAIDVVALACALEQLDGAACIVVANAGTVNTVDFDDLVAIAELHGRHNFWFHIDAAFGGFAACSRKYRPLVQGWEVADSITIDAHKWLNVPYDSAMQFSRHLHLQAEVFQNAASYLESETSEGNFIHLTPENSRRLRALPCWFSLTAYGREGYAEIVERNCRLAQWLAAQVSASEHFVLLAPARLNGICFTLAGQVNDPSPSAVRRFLGVVNESGKLFLTPTIYNGIPAIRVSVTNWRTAEDDMHIAWQTIQQAASLDLG